jgi:hypothetical protein
LELRFSSRLWREHCGGALEDHGYVGRQGFRERQGHDALLFRQRRRERFELLRRMCNNAAAVCRQQGAKTAGDWSIVTREGGVRMWSFSGEPLYTYAKDKKPGDATGDGVGDVWHAAK